MTDMTGMDVEAVRRIASGLRRHAGDIRAIEHHVDAVVAQINGSWQGNRARQFVSDWQSHHRNALRVLAERVDGLGQSALNNAAEQENASRGGAGATGGAASGPSGAPSAWNRFVSGLDDGLPFATGLLGAAAALSANKYATGRYTTRWAGLIARGDRLAIPRTDMTAGDLLRFKRSPVTQFLNEHQTLLKRGSSAVNITGSGLDSYAAFNRGDVRNGVADGAHTALNVADATPLGKAPHAWAVKTTASLWVEVGRAATNPAIDYSSKGMGQVFTASPGEWATAIKDSLPDLGKALGRVF